MGTTHFVASTGNDFPTESLKDWVARVPRKVVLHRMDTAECLEDRVFWAIILWSWCGPQVSDAVVIKDPRGYIQKDAAGKAVPAKLGDLLSLLGLAPGMKGHLSRAVQRLKAKDSVHSDGRVLYPVKEPAPPENPSIVASTGNVFIAGIVINIDEIVASTGNDPGARTETIQWLTGLSTEWKNGLKTLKTGIRTLLVQGFRDRGILISLEEKKRRRETATAAVNGSEPEPAAAVPIPPTPEETAQVQTALSEYGPCDLDTARRMIERCRTKFPDATAEEVTQIIPEKARSIDRGTRKPIGLLLDIVPKSFENYRRPPPERVELETERKIAGWKRAIDEDWETDEGKAAAREYLRQHGIDYAGSKRE